MGAIPWRFKSSPRHKLKDLKAGIKILLQKFYEAGSRKFAKQIICDQVLSPAFSGAKEAGSGEECVRASAFCFGEIQAGFHKYIIYQTGIFHNGF